MKDRRNAFKSMIALAAAPAILKVEMIMPVKPVVTPYEIGRNLVAFSDPNSVTIKVSNVYSGDIVSIVDVEARQIIAQEECLIDKKPVIFKVPEYTSDMNLIVRNPDYKPLAVPFSADKDLGADITIVHVEDKIIG